MPTDAVDRDAVQPVVREAVVIAGLIALVVLGTLLPGAGREVPGTTATVGELVVAVGTLAVVGTMLYAAPNVRQLVVASLRGPADAVDDAGAAVQYLVVFGSVLVAHWGLAPLIAPVFDATWAYDLTFAMLALLPLGVIAHRFYRALDPIVGMVTALVVGAGPVPRASAAERDPG